MCLSTAIRRFRYDFLIIYKYQIILFGNRNEYEKHEITNGDYQVTNTKRKVYSPYFGQDTSLKLISFFYS